MDFCGLIVSSPVVAIQSNPFSSKKLFLIYKKYV